MFAFGVFFLRVLTVLFFVGLAGSAIVVLISFIEDFKELFAPDDPVEGAHAPRARQQTPSS